MSQYLHIISSSEMIAIISLVIIFPSHLVTEFKIVFMCVCIYIYIHIYMCVCVCVYIYL